jgi:tripartite-type tricarboxylate transporter receptor subunit TctC
MRILAKRGLRALLALAASAGVSSALAQGADNYPARPIRILVPYQPGGATDITARIVAARLPDAIGQQVIVENRPGANGNIAIDALAAAAPDGYTLLVGNVSTNAINETTYAGSLRSKPSRDLVGVTNLTEIPHVLVVSAQFAPKTVKELVELAKAQPRKINYASVGGGSYPHLDMVRFSKATGTDMTHIPYKGGAGQVLPALISNEVNVSFLNLASTLPHIKAGKLRPLATTAPARLVELPELPTMAELGLEGIGTNAWQGLFAPAATPKPVLDKLHGAIAKVMAPADVKEQLAKQMMTLVISKSPQEFTDYMRAETKKWADFLAQNPVNID